MNVSILHLKYEYGARSESRFAYYSHCYVTWCPLTTGSVAFTMPVSKVRYAHGALPHTFRIGVFKSIENNSTIVKYIYNMSLVRISREHVHYTSVFFAVSINSYLALWEWFSRDVLPLTCCEHGPPGKTTAHFSKCLIATLFCSTKYHFTQSNKCSGLQDNYSLVSHSNSVMSQATIMWPKIANF